MPIIEQSGKELYSSNPPTETLLHDHGLAFYPSGFAIDIQIRISEQLIFSGPTRAVNAEMM